MSTLVLILCVLRDLYLSGRRREAFTQRYLRNSAPGALARKLVLQDVDSPALEAVIQGSADPPNHPIVDAYDYLMGLARAEKHRGAIDPAGYADRVLAGVEIADLSLTSPSDNPNQVFHALNATGQPLTELEKVKNYLFMSMGSATTSSFHVWQQMTAALPGAQLEDFLLSDLISRRRITARKNIYDTYRAALIDKENDPSAFRRELARLQRQSKQYERIVRPREKRSKGFPGTLDGRLSFLDEWGSLPAHPMILKLLEAQSSGAISPAQLNRALAEIEGFLVRRFLTGVAASPLRGLFTNVMKDFRIGRNPARSVHDAILASDSHKWATDRELRRAILDDPIYDRRRRRYLLLLFQRIASLSQGKDIPDMRDWQIDHLRPQSPGPRNRSRWVRDLNRWERRRGPRPPWEEGLHVLGNLAATPNNPNMQDKPWDSKRKFLTNSGFSLNRRIGSKRRWSTREARNNGRWLAREITRIWTGPRS